MLTWLLPLPCAPTFPKIPESQNPKSQISKSKIQNPKSQIPKSKIPKSQVQQVFGYQPMWMGPGWPCGHHRTSTKDKSKAGELGRKANISHPVFPFHTDKSTGKSGFHLLFAACLWFQCLPQAVAEKGQAIPVVLKNSQPTQQKGTGSIPNYLRVGLNSTGICWPIRS